MKKIITHFFELLRSDSPDESLLLDLIEQISHDFSSFPLQQCTEYIKKKEFESLKRTLTNFFKQDAVAEETSSVEGLKTRLYFLEIQHSILSQKLSNLERQLWQFKQRYHEELNDYISRLLDLKWEVLALKKEKDESYLEDFNEIDEERKTYKEFLQDEQHQKPFFLSSDEEEDLQKYYRAASKLCHPDLVVDEFKQDAEKWFIELSNAYQNKNLERVRWIFEQLDRREIIFPKITEELSSRDLVLASIRKLEKRNHEIEKEIENIQQSSIYRNIIANPDLNVYFENLKRHFVSEIEILEKELTLLRA